MKCVSLLKDKSRCINNRVGSSYHCDHHREKAKSLYLKYKHLQARCEEQIVDDNNIESVEKYYILLNKCFKAREKHRTYAFDEQYWDKGHNHQFTILLEKMEYCEVILERLYNNSIIDVTEEDLSEEEKVQHSKNINKFVNNWKEYRAKIREECDIFVSQCIKENQDYVEEHRKLSFHLFKSACDLFYIKEVDLIFFVTVTDEQPIHLQEEFTKIPGTKYSSGYINSVDKRTGKDKPFDTVIVHTLSVTICKFIEELVRYDFFTLKDKASFKAIFRECDDKLYYENLDNNTMKNVFNLIIFHKLEIQSMIKFIIFSVLDFYEEKAKRKFKFLDGHLLLNEHGNFCFVTDGVNKNYIFKSNENMEEDEKKLKHGIIYNGKQGKKSKKCQKL